MEAILTAAALIASFCTLVGFYRANRVLADLPANKTAFLSGKVASLMISAGKWLTLTGGVATMPLAAVLFFAPDAPGFQWAAATGFAGCLAFVLAALLLVPAGLMNGLARSTHVKHLASAGARFVRDKGLSLARQKAFWLSLAGITIMVAFMPWIVDLLTFVGYAALLVVAGKLGLIDASSHLNNHKDHYMTLMGGFYNYRTGKMEGYGGKAFYSYYADDD